MTCPMRADDTALARDPPTQRQKCTLFKYPGIPLL